MPLPAIRRVLPLLLALSLPVAGRAADPVLSSKTPYPVPPATQVLTPVPPGFEPVYVQMLARHGSRAMTSPRFLEKVERALALAREEHALTPAGQRFGELVATLREASEAIGFGNLSGQGQQEARQLGARLAMREADLLRGAARGIEIVTSGKPRAEDSARAFLEGMAGVQGGPAALDVLPWHSDPATLYFHAGNPAYRLFLAQDPRLKTTLGNLRSLPETRKAAHGALVPLFADAFLDRLAAGRFQLQDVKDETDLALAIYDLYGAAADLQWPGRDEFARFLPAESAAWFGFLADAGDFYRKGPSFKGSSVTFAMARPLQDDFFAHVEALRGPRPQPVATLRFAHAETLIPLAALMALPGSERQSDVYRHRDNPWRGASVSPMAANLQWQVYRNASGQLLVRLLYNERESRFAAFCTPVAPGSPFYDFDALKRCYGY